MKINEEFDAREQDMSTDFELLPDNERLEICLTESEFKENKAGTGTNLKLVFQVLGPKFAGRKIFENLVWAHSESETAVKIGRSRFAALCKAVNILCPHDTDELHNVAFSGLIGIKKGTNGYGDQNTIKTFVPAKSSQTEKPVSNKKGSWD